MPSPDAAQDLYRTLQRLQLVVLAAGRQAWSRMGSDFDPAWRGIAPGLVVFTSAAQLAAARAATAYVPAVLEETGQPDEPLAEIRPQAFAGRATDGRSLAGLLTGSVVAAKEAVGAGSSPTVALASGRRRLESVLHSVVEDAARDATQAAVAVRPAMRWVRMVNPPCCSRCAVLAGRVYSWNASFDRHLNCDCLAIPTTVANADSYLSSPTELARRGLITDLSADQRQRIDDGADLTKVLNESRDQWRERMAADRRAAGPVDRLGRARPVGWNGGGTNPPPVGATIHDLMDQLTSQVEFARAARAAGIAA